jgi:predicted acyl esterase
MKLAWFIYPLLSSVCETSTKGWSNGVVGAFGGSYLGATQWLPARERPPALRAMAPSITFPDNYEGCSYQGGAKGLHDLRWVVANIVLAEIERRIARGEQVLESDAPLDVDGALSELPLATHALIREYAPFYLDWLAHPTADDYWLPSSPQAGYDRSTSSGSTYGPRRMCSYRATASAWRFRAATSRALTATATRAA